MKKWTVNELRELYLSFFESKDHLRLKSFSLIPHNDNSLLLINSGMAPLKPYFKGLETPPRKRITTCQKCIRTGDIENIGHTARHGTFFEMLGNFSFGDYFKKEAITWSWEFLTVTLGFDKDRLYPSVYKDDDEAYDLWHDYIGIPSERIFKFGKEDNFWEHGSGPCGPCSEIYYDRGEKYGCGKPTCTVGCDCDRYMEIWNNVFTQFDNDGKGNYTELAQKNIDTGMGLERLAVVCQDVESIFEIDTNKDLMEAISLVTRHIYKENEKDDISLRIIADHIKSCTFMISDGIMPSNEGRGYVLRRLLRRAVRHGRLLGVKKTFMAELARTVIKLNKKHYTELEEKQDMIINVLNSEEDKFNQTIDQGLSILNNLIDNIEKNKKNELSGEDAFKLYDTYGFPIDLTKEILEEKNIKIDLDKFHELMDNQRKLARNSRKVTNYMGADETVFNTLDPNIVTEFIGYDKEESNSSILFLVNDNKIVNSINENDDECIIITKDTPFYPTMGGQEGDKGLIILGDNEFEVYETIKVLNTKILHIGKVIKGEFKTNDKVCLNVDNVNRHKTSVNHTSTHLLHAALRTVLGKHVEQAGSYVDSSKLRFDFTHYEALTHAQIVEVEDIVNRVINESIKVIKETMPIEKAKSLGAIALFGEKYGDTVRTVKVSDFSFELCGGTHIDNTSEIKYFKIISETAVKAGVRRIEAITNDEIINYLKNKENEINELSKILKTNDIINKLNSILKDYKNLENENSLLKKQLSSNATNDIKFETIDSMNIVVEKYSDKNINELKDIVDTLKDKIKDYAIVALATNYDKVSIVVSISDLAVNKGFHAGQILKQVAKIVDGNGGGKDKFAQGEGKNTDMIDEALKEAKSIFSK